MNGDQDASPEAVRKWPTTPRGKAICPICGIDGWPNGSWARKHAHHEQCSCGRWATRLGPHRASMLRHGKPCP